MNSCTAPFWKLIAYDEHYYGDGTASPSGGATTLGGGTAISGGGTPDTGCGTPFRPVPAEFNH